MIFLQGYFNLEDLTVKRRTKNLSNTGKSLKFSKYLKYYEMERVHRKIPSAPCSQPKYLPASPLRTALTIPPCLDWSQKARKLSWKRSFPEKTFLNILFVSLQLQSFGFQLLFSSIGNLLFLSNVHLALFCLIIVSPKGLQ